jgi:cytidine deaminase
VTPVGTNTSDIADRLRAAFSEWNYRSLVVKVTDFFNQRRPPPEGEFEDERVRRLIGAGDEWCKAHDDAAAVARIGILDVRSKRLALHRQAGAPDSDEVLIGRPLQRVAYIIHSLKRPAEVALLRKTYGPQFVLLGGQIPVDERLGNLKERALSVADDTDRTRVAKDIMALDASEDDPMGQRVNETFPYADYFLKADEQPARFVDLLFARPTVAPTTGELAMYLANATSLRSLATSRRVGAALVAGDSIIAVGANDVPSGEAPDVAVGEDPNQRIRSEVLEDTIEHLKAAGVVPEDRVLDDAEIASLRESMKGSDLMSIIEFQRPIHAEVAAISDAARRGHPVEGSDLYCTTFPCHLCFKSALAVGVNCIHYIEPYTKSRAEQMFPKSIHRLTPYEGVSPRMYLRAFDRPVVRADPDGAIPELDRTTALPNVPNAFAVSEVAAREAEAVARLDLAQR